MEDDSELDHGPPTADELLTHHGTFILKLYEELSCLPLKVFQPTIHYVMYIGLKRIARRNLGKAVYEAGKVETVEQRRKFVKQESDSPYFEREYWVENKNCRLYSILKTVDNILLRYIVIFSKNYKGKLSNISTPGEILWVYSGQDTINNDPYITLLLSLISTYFIIDADYFTIEHFRRLTNEFQTSQSIISLSRFYFKHFLKDESMPYFDPDQLLSLYENQQNSTEKQKIEKNNNNNNNNNKSNNNNSDSKGVSPKHARLMRNITKKDTITDQDSEGTNNSNNNIRVNINRGNTDDHTHRIPIDRNNSNGTFSGDEQTRRRQIPVDRNNNKNRNDIQPSNYNNFNNNQQPINDGQIRRRIDLSNNRNDIQSNNTSVEYLALSPRGESYNYRSKRDDKVIQGDQSLPSSFPVRTSNNTQRSGEDRNNSDNSNNSQSNNIVPQITKSTKVILSAPNTQVIRPSKELDNSNNNSSNTTTTVPVAPSIPNLSMLRQKEMENINSGTNSANNSNGVNSEQRRARLQKHITTNESIKKDGIDVNLNIINPSTTAIINEHTNSNPDLTLTSGDKNSSDTVFSNSDFNNNFIENNNHNVTSTPFTSKINAENNNNSNDNSGERDTDFGVPNRISDKSRLKQFKDNTVSSVKEVKTRRTSLSSPPVMLPSTIEKISKEIEREQQNQSKQHQGQFQIPSRARKIDRSATATIGGRRPKDNNDNNSDFISEFADMMVSIENEMNSIDSMGVLTIDNNIVDSTNNLDNDSDNYNLNDSNFNTNSRIDYSAISTHSKGTVKLQPQTQRRNMYKVDLDRNKPPTDGGKKFEKIIQYQSAITSPRTLNSNNMNSNRSNVPLSPRSLNSNNNNNSIPLSPRNNTNNNNHNIAPLSPRSANHNNNNIPLSPRLNNTNNNTTSLSPRSMMSNGESKRPSPWYQQLFENTETTLKVPENVDVYKFLDDYYAQHLLKVNQTENDNNEDSINYDDRTRNEVNDNVYNLNKVNNIVDSDNININNNNGMIPIDEIDLDAINIDDLDTIDIDDLIAANRI